MRSYAVACFLLCCVVFAQSQLLDGRLLESVCSRPENQQVCEALMQAIVKEIRSAPREEQVVEDNSAMEVEKRKPSFVRFGKRSDVVEKRKPSFVRFGRK